MGGMSAGGGAPIGMAQALEQGLRLEKAARLKREEEERRKQTVKFFTEFQSVAFDKAAAYTAIIMSGGYVGLFTIWGWVQAYLQRWEVLSIALMVGFSLLVFVLWQIYIMTVFGRMQMELAEVISATPANFDSALEKHQKGETEVRNRLAKLWPPVFWASTGPGILGGLLILVACVRHLVVGA